MADIVTKDILKVSDSKNTKLDLEKKKINNSQHLHSQLLQLSLFIEAT